MKVFIAGARSIKSLDYSVQKRIASICSKGYDILVGDCYGVDASVQNFCANRTYKNVTVYASNGIARNNIGSWTIKSVAVDSSAKGFDFYRQKDISMSKDADCGFMVWDGQSKGTLYNIASLVFQNKPVIVYLEPLTKTFRIGSHAGLVKLLSLCPTSTQENYRKIINLPEQMSLLA